MKFVSYLIISLCIFTIGHAQEAMEPLADVKVVNGYVKVKAPQNKNFFVYHEEYTHRKKTLTDKLSY